MAEAAKNILSRVDFLQLIPHKSTTGKRTESKRVQRVATRGLSVSGDIESIDPCTLQAQKGIEACFLDPAQCTLDALSITGHLALFPQARGFKARRAGAPPTVETGKSRPGSHLPTGRRIPPHGT